MIEIKGVTKSFGDLEVLKGIDIHIKKGETFALLGRSGTGKSTLLRCINGLENYDKGSIMVNNIEVKSLAEKETRVFRKDIGMIFQQFSLLNRLSVFENIALPLKCWKYKNNYINKKVKELLEIIGMPEKINARPMELSGGQKQRVAIARALAMEPNILLCDEATSALDPKTSKSIIDLLNQINQELNITIVIVTHQMSVVRSSCEQVAIIEDGKIDAIGSVDQIFLDQPLSLKNLVGHKDLILPQTGVNIEIFFTKENASDPIITKMSRELNIDCIILGGEMEGYKNTTLGSIVINVPEKTFKLVEKYLQINRVTWKYFGLEKQSLKEIG